MRKLGRLDEAEHDLHSAIRIRKELGPPARSMWRAFADVAAARGDDSQATRRLSRSQPARQSEAPPNTG